MPDINPNPLPETTASRGPMTAGRRLRRLLVVNLVLFALVGVVGELGFRLFWNPIYWIQCENWLYGSGHSSAGKKWWPDATYRVQSQEFHTTFRTNALGYRARPQPPTTAHPYRIAFVGDSFTEAMQVPYERSFVARLERGLASGSTGREVVCENFGISATGLFDYYHRIIHDVFRSGSTPPDALVLCLYPGNDFLPKLPDDGFDPEGRPRRDYFDNPSWAWHAATWVNLKSKFGYFVVRSILVTALRFGPQQERTGPRFWWCDPAVAASAPEALPIRRSRALIEAIADECRLHDTRLVVLVVGPASIYAAKNGVASPLARILADWGLDAPVIDLSAPMIALPDYPRFTFPLDGHLNPSGHAYVAEHAVAPLRDALGLANANPSPGQVAAGKTEGGRKY